MTSQEIVIAALAAVERTGIDYVIVGALAVNCYTFARTTKDADFLLGVKMGGIEEVAKHLPSNFIIDPQPRMELITGSYRWIINVVGSDFCVEMFHLSEDAHHQEEFTRRRQTSLSSIDRTIWVPSPEDLVIQKLRWARSKDLDDARNIIAVQADALDFAYIEKWCRQHGTWERFEEIRKSIPEI